MTRHQNPNPSPPAAKRLSQSPPEEALITDARAGLTPAQMVERKLVSLLKSNPLPVSHVQLEAGPFRRRSRDNGRAET
jgi:hypothetical protein